MEMHQVEVGDFRQNYSHHLHLVVRYVYHAYSMPVSLTRWIDSAWLWRYGCGNEVLKYDSTNPNSTHLILIRETNHSYENTENTSAKNIL